MRNTYAHTRPKVDLSNVTPIWLLPFWRLVKGDANGDYAKAWKALPQHLPQGIKCPSVEETAIILVDHGLV